MNERVRQSRQISSIGSPSSGRKVRLERALDELAEWRLLQPPPLRSRPQTDCAVSQCTQSTDSFDAKVSSALLAANSLPLLMHIGLTTSATLGKCHSLAHKSIFPLQVSAVYFGVHRICQNPSVKRLVSQLLPLVRLYVDGISSCFQAARVRAPRTHATPSLAHLVHQNTTVASCL